MNTLVKTISTELDNLQRRIIKFLRFGNSDVQTSFQAGPYGVDSNPVKDVIAIYAPTSEKGKTVIIGYINKNQLAKVGEHRIFSTDAEGNEATYLYLKDDGTMEIGGASDWMVRFSELEAAFNEFLDDYNNHTHPGVIVAVTGGSGAPAVGTPGNTATTDTPSTADISGAKIEEIKTL